MVTRAGVEPTTFSLGRSCSIQLSYQAIPTLYHIIYFSTKPHTHILFLLLPRLGLWSRDKAAKGIAVVAIDVVVVGRIDATIVEAEVVGALSVGVGSRRPVIAVLASTAELISTVRIDTAAPHKEQKQNKISNPK